MVMEFRFHPKNYSLAKTIRSGQLFRYTPIGRGAFHLVVGNRVCNVQQQEEFGTVSVYSDNRDDMDFWRDFLAFEEPDEVELKWLMQRTPKLAEAYEMGRGLRILHQPAWEALVGFIISQRNNIPRIKQCVDRMCQKLGAPINLEDNRFPTPEVILPGTLADCGLGYRESYIYSVASAVKSGELDLERLHSKSGCSSIRALQELERLQGVGPKVARCVALFGLGHTDLFPVDIWIERAIRQGVMAYEDIEIFGRLSGLIQQYVYYYMLQTNGREA